MNIDVNDILGRCKSEEGVAQKQLYDRYSKLLIGVIIRYVSDINTAQDVLQETFIRVFKYLPKSEITKESEFKSWACRIAINESLRWLRSNKKHVHDPIEYVGDKKKNDFSSELEKNDLLQMIYKLPPGFRTVFCLNVIDGFSHREIAEQLDITESTSRSQLLRARKQLQQMVINMNAYERTK